MIELEQLVRFNLLCSSVLRACRCTIESNQKGFEMHVRAAEKHIELLLNRIEGRGNETESD